MSFDWPEFTIDELKASTKGAIAMGPFGSRIKAENFVDSGVPVLKGGNLHGAYINDSDCDFLTEEKADELKSSVVYEGDIVITHRGTIGQVSIVSDESKYPRYVVSQSQLKISLDKTKVNPYYVNYYLRSRLGQHQLLSFASQVGVPAIAKASTSVKQIRVPCPPLTIQGKIVDFIRAIDRKLTNNSSVNQTLEEMAQAIFKSWFVDFEPVKAKMNGEQPEGMDAATASLFPEKLVSDTGLPEGWKLSEIGDEVAVVGGGTPSKKNDDFWVGGHIHWTSPKDLSGVQDKVLLDTASKLTEAGLKKVSSGLLPVDTVLLSSRAPVGYLALAKVPLAVNQGYIAMRCEKALPPEFVLQWCVHRMDEIKQRASGSTFAEISKKNFKPISVVVPSEDVLNAYQKLVKPLYDAITSNVRQSEQLSNLRDTLLPKLLSGQLDLERN
ncbi:restriction endonuclease subunit S [Vibrio alginolyticus]